MHVGRVFCHRTMDGPGEQREGTRLYAHRAKADEYNIRRLNGLDSVLHSFRTLYEGDERYFENAQKAMPIPEELHLKRNALVMMRKNDPSYSRLYVNGSLGHVTRIDDEELEIRLLTGDLIEVKREKFSYLSGDGNEIVAAWNFPISLAWATTIHKAQGASLDRMTVDLSALWEPGQAYVAPGRVGSPPALPIERWSQAGTRADPFVTELYNSLSTESQNYVPRPFFTVREVSAPEPKEKVQKVGKKEQRVGEIRGLIEKSTPLREMASAVNVKPDRVLLYIEECLKAGDRLSVSYLLNEIPEASRIREAFEEHGMERLKPVSEALDDEFSFTELRAVRCVMMAEEGF